MKFGGAIAAGGQFHHALGSVAATWPFAVRAQPAKGPLGLGLPIGSPENKYDQSLVEAFRQGLRIAGLVEDRDVVLDVIWSGGEPNEAVNEALKRRYRAPHPLWFKRISGGKAPDLNHSNCVY